MLPTIDVPKPIDEDDQYFTFQKDETVYKVEKEICRDIIKPNILKYEHQIPEIKEKLIYPYTNGITPLSLMEENVLKEKSIISGTYFVI